MAEGNPISPITSPPSNSIWIIICKKKFKEVINLILKIYNLNPNDFKRAI